MTVNAYTTGDVRFIGTMAQWDRFVAANDVRGYGFGLPTDDERARWRKERGCWFVVPTLEHTIDAEGQYDSEKDVIRAEESTCQSFVAIYKNPNHESVECLTLLNPDDADALARQLMRMAKAVRTYRAEQAKDDAVDETQWEQQP